MGRGLLNIYDMYIHGEETASMEGAHQSGTMIKKLVTHEALAYGVVSVHSQQWSITCAKQLPLCSKLLCAPAVNLK
jgi:hypothetical protein